MKPRSILASAFAIMLAAGCVRAQSGYQLGGNLDLTQLEVETPDGTTSSLSQKYNLNVQRAFTPALSAQASLRYYRLSQDFDTGGTVLNELQPMGQLAWTSPWFFLGLYGQRSVSESDIPGNANLTRENGSVNLRTISDDLPTLTARYDASRVYTPDSLQVRNMFEERLMGGAVWQVKNHTLTYQATSQTTENMARETVQRGTSHNFLWDQNTVARDGRLRFRSEYVLNYRQDSFEKPDSTQAMRQIPIQQTYFTTDRTPQLSDLDTVFGLTDGNRTASPSKTIALGPEQTYANIAMDLGRSSDAGIVYVYTNQKARSGGTWSAYVSDPSFASNDMEWTPLIGGVTSAYDEGELRFVLTFRNTGARFLKIVFEGTSDTSHVEVTEVEVYRSEGSGGPNRFESSYQIVSLNSSYLFSEKYDASLDVGFRDEPFSPDGLKKKMTSTPRYPGTRGSLPC